MKRIIVLSLILILTSCAWHEVQRDRVTVDGQDFLCSKTVNRFSHNESDPQCAPFNEPNP